MQYKTGDLALTTVVGNWIYDFSFAVFDGETVELKRFEEIWNRDKLSQVGIWITKEKEL